MVTIATVIALAPIALLVYAYIVYPVVVGLIATLRPARAAAPARSDWPFVTITVPVYNAAASLAKTLHHLLAVDYPRDRLQILVISDASTDGTDDLARSFADRGVDLLRLPRRIGKTAAENAAVGVALGEIIVNVDATILIPAASLKPLIRAFDDPTVGVASGRDVSVGVANLGDVKGEASYTSYEMWLRGLETRAGSIVGASGCFYGIRRGVHADPLPNDLSWDFASPLVARRQGYRAVSVHDAICIVPRASAIRTEIRRKVRTMARGISTLFYLRSLMNPLVYGGFALMLVSHKLLRWIPYLLTPLSLLALAYLAPVSGVASAALLAVVLLGIAGIAGMRMRRSQPPRMLALASFMVAVACSGFLAWWKAIRRTPMAMWEPTPRPATQA
jgi:cellulose synthase/poly-beta-1,6-N-acetylglucosamine synthase-like glycosyltransferase